MSKNEIRRENDIKQREIGIKPREISTNLRFIMKMEETKEKLAKININ